MADYQGLTALVTGAASGIGRATAMAYLAHGANVMMCDMRHEALGRVIDHVPVEQGDRARHSVANVMLSADIRQLVSETLEAFGTIDILVNAAGIYPSHPVLDMTEDDWDTVLDTNLKGPFLVSQAVARIMVAGSRPGNIVNITSGAAYRARPGAAHYVTSKAGLVMLTQSLAIELAPYGIRVNAVSPGFVAVNSDINQLSDDYVNAIVGTIPLGRAGAPEDIAAAVLFLTGPDSLWTTGTILRVDGGSSAGTTQLPLSRISEK